MAKQNQCKQCSEKYIIDDQTIEFLKKIAPTFDGKKFEIPANHFCEECRHIRRMLWRNETHLYNRKCDLCAKQILSMYRPDSEHTVYCLQCWWSDKWEAQDYALDYDPKKRFLDQLSELYKKVPQPGLTVTNSTNCDYCSNTVDSKNCYMMFSARGEDCMYGRKAVDCREVVDSLFGSNSEKCYEIVFSDNCYDCKYVHESRNCSESMFLYDCVDCSDCFMCSNQRNKRFMVRNQPVSREQYDELMKNEWSGSREQADKLYEEFESLILKSIHRENRNFKCEGCTGDHLIECNDCTECFEVLRADNCRRMYDSMGAPSADCMDCDHTPGGQLNYETSSCYPIWNSAFSLLVYDGRNAYYSINCFNNCDFIFGCVGLKKKEYCILNKKYSKQEYEKLVGDIIISMIEDDDWGKFFPPNMSPYAYNESIANDYWPKNKTESIKSGFCWLEKDYSPKFGGEFYEPLDDIAEYAGDEDKQNELLNSIIKCNISGKPFKIIPKELAFYLKNNIPIPRVSFFERHKERMKFRNPRELFERKCDLCNKNMQTSYAPDRLEKVYCVDCYQKTVL